MNTDIAADVFSCMHVFAGGFKDTMQVVAYNHLKWFSSHTVDGDLSAGGASEKPSAKLDAWMTARWLVNLNWCSTSVGNSSWRCRFWNRSCSLSRNICAESCRIWRCSRGRCQCSCRRVVAKANRWFPSWRGMNSGGGPVLEELVVNAVHFERNKKYWCQDCN